MRRRLVVLYCILAAANLGTWGWALLEFGRDPVLLGTTFLAYGFGLRHAVDADHIAAIDNVTRKLLQQGRGALGVGFFFSLGHSTVVVAASIVVAFAANLYRVHAESLHRIGGMFGALVSAGFLFAIALANLATFWSVFRHGPVSDVSMQPAVKGGILARLFQPMFAIVSRSWHMYPLGFLFGLGFDTATEIGLLTISAAEGSRGLSAGAMLVFPALFTAGMSLVDTTDGLLMLKAYGWASASPFRRLYYNMTVTLVSALVAFVIGGIQLFGLIGDPWRVAESAGIHFGAIGSAIVAVFLTLWGAAVLLDRFKRYDDRLDAPASP